MALNIMIVDDSPLIRTFIRHVISLMRLDVEEYWEARDGEDALKLLHERRIDLVLTDINMPRMNGAEFVRRLKSDDLLRTIPVIGVSTDSSNSRMQQMLALGVEGYVIKPFLPEALCDEVKKILGGVS